LVAAQVAVRRLQLVAIVVALVVLKVVTPPAPVLELLDKVLLVGQLVLAGTILILVVVEVLGQ
jgi:hypothetical protein